MVLAIFQVVIPGDAMNNIVVASKIELILIHGCEGLQ